MGDSDDEYDRKRRDKFRGERTESYSRESRRGSTEGRREEWSEREGSWGGGRSVARQPRGEFREYRGRERYSPVPPMKRFKPDAWDDRRYPEYGSYTSSWSHDYAPPERSYPQPHRRVERDTTGMGMGTGASLDTQPAMMSFKAFLAQQDDTITDEEAIAKYNDYKLDFKRIQLNEFFVGHKDEEWFKIKYHPEDSVKRKEEQLNYLKKRVQVFTEFMEKGLLEQVRLDAEQTDDLVKLMDRLVIKLEGGTEVDWLALEAEAEAEAETEKSSSDTKKQDGDTECAVEKPVTTTTTTLTSGEDKNIDNIKKEEKINNGKDDVSEKSEGAIGEEQVVEEVEGETMELRKPDEDKKCGEDVVGENANKAKAKAKGGKRKRSYDFESGSGSGSGSASESDDEDADEDGKSKKGALTEPPPPGEEAKNDTSSAGKNSNPASPAVRSEVDEADVVEVERKRKDLHKTASVFLRTLAPSITKAEVEAMCRRYPGFLRVALAEPQYERRWFRRGWVTFERFVNIKEICWNLNNIRLRDCELGAIVNKDLTRRVRTVAGVASHKQVVRNDIKLAAKMTHTLDSRNGLWQDGHKDKDTTNRNNTPSFGLVSSNPVLENITDYLIEEGSAEEEELLGVEGDNSGQASESTVERDEMLISVLDRLLLYLRVVFSIDYYNHCEYTQEDEMPNRCGLIHVRGPPPTTKVAQEEIQDYSKQFEAKISSLVTPNNLLTPAELAKLGAKNAEKEVENFIQANTQELSKDKWLCPLSGKKFKGPDFVRKHIQNKHGEKVQEVIKEVEYFNNYLADPRRPMLPEHPGARVLTKRDPESGYSAPAQSQAPSYTPHMGGYGFGPRGGYGYGGYGGYRGMRGNYRARGGGGGGISMPMQDFRPVIHYRDLDAPREPDEFI